MSDRDSGSSGIPGETPIYDALRVAVEDARGSDPEPVEPDPVPLDLPPADPAVLSRFRSDPLGAPVPAEVLVELPSPSPPRDDEHPLRADPRSWDTETEVPLTPWIPTQSRSSRTTHAREGSTSSEEPAPAPIVLPGPAVPTHDQLDFPVGVLRGLATAWPWDTAR